MLVLSRKVGESIVINESIRVTVVQSAKNGRIRLGIDAPPEIRVLREELTKSLQLIAKQDRRGGSTNSFPPNVLSKQVQPDLPAR